MSLNKLLDMYDNWNGITKVNDTNLNTIVKTKTWQLYENYKDLCAKQVVSFGFYDGEFCVRVK